MADTMFAKRKAILIEALDSTCAAQFEIMKQRSIDSLFALEKERIEELSE